VAANPGLIRRLVAAGEEIGNHSWSHHRMVLHSSRFYDAEIVRTDAAIRAAGAPQPSLFRAPYTKKLIGLPLALERHHERLISAEIVDPPGVTDPRLYAADVVREARPGSIILMHLMSEGNQPAHDALPLVLDGLQRRGFRVVTVGELLRHADRG
jgi:peptidoglycan/xylan/chitin deacetylase (PgdA/CDA1 family)